MMELEDYLWEAFLAVFIYPSYHALERYLESLQSNRNADSAIKYHAPHLYRLLKYINRILHGDDDNERKS